MTVISTGSELTVAHNVESVRCILACLNRSARLYCAAVKMIKL